MSKTSIALALLLVLAAHPQVLEAQCPDGAPPPCNRAAVAQSSRRVAPNPAIDAGRWIIVPFDNLAKAADAEWMRSASVNLLYLDMSRWQDIRVVDDERVADLLRETADAGERSALSLTVGLAVAKRAGAGKLVMGDVLKLGNRTTVTAKVYDVRTGQRVRSVKEEVTAQDSVIALFGKLAQKILNVAPPAGANVGSIGTTRTDAYQEYLAGVTALNRFELTESRKRFGQAIALDSTFALAHYKMALLSGWENMSSTLWRAHAEAAARYASVLPKRERSLIGGYVHLSARDYTKAYEVFSSLVAADSSDVDAWYNMGECLYHDLTMRAVGGDTTKLQFRGDWNASNRVFQRVLQLDPQYHLAYQHIIDALTPVQHPIARYCVDGTTQCTRYTAHLIRDADSLIMTPYVVGDTAALRVQERRYAQTQSRRRNLTAAREVATLWAREAPAESRSQFALAALLLAQGRLLDAKDALARTRSGTGSWSGDQRRMFMHAEIAVKLGNGREASRLYDSTRAAVGTVSDPTNARILRRTLASYGPPLGRLREYDSLMKADLAAAPLPVYPWMRRSFRAWVGAPPLDDSLAYYENAYFETVKANQGVIPATFAVGASLMFSLREPRARWPAIDQSLREPLLAPAQALARGDTAGVRTAAQTLDSIVRSAVSRMGPDTIYTMLAVDAYLVLNDTASALRTLRFGLDSAAALSPYFPGLTAAITFAFAVPRLTLLRADLAAARGSKDEARVWYARFIDLWAAGDAEVQPLVARARRSFIAAGGKDP